MSEKKSTVGDPIWVESIMSDKDYKEMSHKFPNTYKSGNKTAMFECDFKWRYGMGYSLSDEEIKIITNRFDFILKKAGLI
jgi:DNA polymerase III alpha subunit (gram-positive type)